MGLNGDQVNWFLYQGRKGEKNNIYTFKSLTNMYRDIAFSKELFLVISTCWSLCDIKRCLIEVYIFIFKYIKKSQHVLNFRIVHGYMQLLQRHCGILFFWIIVANGGDNRYVSQIPQSGNWTAPLWCKTQANRTSAFLYSSPFSLINYSKKYCFIWRSVIGSRHSGRERMQTEIVFSAAC